MANSYPEWATKKQLEGMQEFNSVLDEYLSDMSVEYKPSDSCDGDDSRFYAVLSWENVGQGKGKRECEFDIAFDYEHTWNHLGERIYHWQILFSGGDATREISNEIVFMALFQYLDGQLILPE